MVRGILARRKRYVTVEATTSAEVVVTPDAVLWPDGRRFEIGEVLDVRTAESKKAGGRGTRYTVRVGGQVTFLYGEGGRWFVEEKVFGELAGRD